MWRLLVAFCCVAGISSASFLGTTGYVSVHTRITCLGQPIRDTIVQLNERDALDPDDTLDEVMSNDGVVELSGQQTEWAPISPFVALSYDCVGEVKLYEFDIAPKYVASKPKDKRKVFNEPIELEPDLMKRPSGKSRSEISDRPQSRPLPRRPVHEAAEESDGFEDF